MLPVANISYVRYLWLTYVRHHSVGKGRQLSISAGAACAGRRELVLCHWSTPPQAACWNSFIYCIRRACVGVWFGTRQTPHLYYSPHLIKIWSLLVSIHDLLAQKTMTTLKREAVKIQILQIL